MRRHHVALLALFIALGGTSYAAITLPAGSVGTKQLKKNAVTSKKVKNSSLQAKDFAPGSLPAGPRGATGPTGPRGPAGQQGLRGLTGARGPSDAFTAFFGNFDVPPAAAEPFTLAELDLE